MWSHFASLWLLLCFSISLLSSFLKSSYFSERIDISYFCRPMTWCPFFSNTPPQPSVHVLPSDGLAWGASRWPKMGPRQHWIPSATAINHSWMDKFTQGSECKTGSSYILNCGFLSWGRCAVCYQEERPNLKTEPAKESPPERQRETIFGDEYGSLWVLLCLKAVLGLPLTNSLFLSSFPLSLPSSLSNLYFFCFSLKNQTGLICLGSTFHHLVLKFHFAYLNIILDS